MLRTCPIAGMVTRNRPQGIFFGQLIAQARCMPKECVLCIITGLQNFAALPLAKLGERARPCLPRIAGIPLIWAALLSASIASELPGAGEKQRLESFTQTPHIPGADL